MAESRIPSYDPDSDTVEWFYDDHKTEERIYVQESGLDCKLLLCHACSKS